MDYNNKILGVRKLQINQRQYQFVATALSDYSKDFMRFK
jgi:hypothetical protein